MDEKVERLESWADGVERGPHRLEIHPTNRCNLKCSMCGTRAAWRKEGLDRDEALRQNEQREMDFGKLLDLVDEAGEMNVNRVLLTGGGEPFIRKETTLKMMKRIKENGIFGNLNTNGTLLDEEDIERIVDMGWDLIIFSIDSGTADTHDGIRGVAGTYKDAVRNMFHFKRMKKENNTDKPEVVFNTVVTEKNYREFPELFHLGNQVGCNDITFIPLINSGNYPDLNVKDKKNLIKKLKETKEIGERYNIHNNVDETIEQYRGNEGNENDDERPEESDKNDSFEDIPCFEPFLNVVVRMDGHVTPCCMIDNQGMDLKEKSLKEIWESEYYKELRKNFRKHDIPKGCEECILSKENRNKDLREGLSVIDD